MVTEIREPLAALLCVCHHSPACRQPLADRNANRTPLCVVFADLPCTLPAVQLQAATAATNQANHEKDFYWHKLRCVELLCANPSLHDVAVSIDAMAAALWTNVPLKWLKSVFWSSTWIKQVTFIVGG